MTIKRLTPVALAVSLIALGQPAIAGESIEFGPGLKLDWRVNLTYTLSQRLEDRDPTLAGFAGANDGDVNFAKGALTSNRLGALLDTKLSKGDSGLVLSASTFYDDVYHKSNDASPGSGLPNATYNPDRINHGPPFNEFTPEARKYHGGYSRFLDAYGYTAFDLGEGRRLTTRLGRHAVSWGEALFFPGISAAQGPFDGTKTGIPGTEVKDSILPEDQISASLEINPRWSVMAHAQYNWHPTIAPAPGSYLNTSEATGPGATCLAQWTALPAVPGAFPSGFTGCAFGNRQPDITPGKTGQFGVGTRFRVTDETEVGVYYLNYHDRTPLPEINAFTPGVVTPAFFNIPGNQIGNGSYRIRYFDDIKLLGASFNTTFGLFTLAGEVSYKDGAPVLVNTLVNPAAPNAASSYIPNPTRAKITQVNLNAFANLGRVPFAGSLLLIGEISAIQIGKVEARKAPGVENLPAANQAFFPAGDVLSFETKKALAVQGQIVLGYPGIFEGWDLTIPISYSQQLNGRTIIGGVAGEGDKRISLGATFVMDGNFSIGATYLGFMGGASIAPLKTQRLLTDRDQLSLVAKYSF